MKEVVFLQQAVVDFLMIFQTQMKQKQLTTQPNGQVSHKYPACGVLWIPAFNFLVNKKKILMCVLVALFYYKPVARFSEISKNHFTASLDICFSYQTL